MAGGNDVDRDGFPEVLVGPFSQGGMGVAYVYGGGGSGLGAPVTSLGGITLNGQFGFALR